MRSGFNTDVHNFFSVMSVNSILYYSPSATVVMMAVLPSVDWLYLHRCLGTRTLLPTWHHKQTTTYCKTITGVIG